LDKTQLLHLCSALHCLSKEADLATVDAPVGNSSL
jgi:hypothetical protein